MAVRIAIEHGLHYEDGTSIEESLSRSDAAPLKVTPHAHTSEVTRPAMNAKEKGRREWVRDLRRRLWWCVFFFDRLVHTYVGRPVSIPDHVISTDFPSVLDDRHITTSGLNTSPTTLAEPSNKRLAHHYFRFRLLQSETLQVRQDRHARQAREKEQHDTTRWMRKKLTSPFMDPFGSFAAWRIDIDQRLSG